MLEITKNLILLEIFRKKKPRWNNVAIKNNFSHDFRSQQLKIQTRIFLSSIVNWAFLKICWVVRSHINSFLLETIDFESTFNKIDLSFTNHHIVNKFPTISHEPCSKTKYHMYKWSKLHNLQIVEFVKCRFSVVSRLACKIIHIRAIYIQFYIHSANPVYLASYMVYGRKVHKKGKLFTVEGAHWNLDR